MMINFQKNSITFSSTFFILALSVIIFLSSACVGIAGRGPYYPQDVAARRGDLGSIQGLWLITASNYSGKLEFHWERGMWVGRVWFDALQQWEPLTDIFFGPDTGEIRFTRVTYSQLYTGTVSGNQILGTYTTFQGGSGPWAATREAIKRGPVDFRGIQGLWFLNAGNWTGKMEFHWERDMWVGRVWFDAFRQWEPLTEIIFDPRTGELQFTRPNYGQRYVGTLSGNQLAGTFADQGGTLPWEARRH